MDDFEEDKLDHRATNLIDQHLKVRVTQAFLFLGVVNISALFGIYTFVSEKAAELAANKAISSTESQLEGLSKQFDQLSTRTTDGFANALMSLGEAKAKVDAINKDVLGLKELKIDHVNEVTEILNQSSEELASLIESAKAIKEIEQTKENIDRDISELREKIESSNKKLTMSILENSNLADINSFSVEDNGTSSVYKSGEILIETGVNHLQNDSHVSQIKFKAKFLNAPTVIASGESTNKYDYGYATVGDITKTGFTSTLSDKVANNDKTLPRKGGKINYVAIGIGEK